MLPARRATTPLAVRGLPRRTPLAEATVKGNRALTIAVSQLASSAIQMDANDHKHPSDGHEISQLARLQPWLLVHY